MQRDSSRAQPSSGAPRPEDQPTGELSGEEGYEGAPPQEIHGTDHPPEATRSPERGLPNSGVDVTFLWGGALIVLLAAILWILVLSALSASADEGTRSPLREEEAPRAERQVLAGPAFQSVATLQRQTDRSTPAPR